MPSFDSIHNSPVDDLSGRHSRKGFHYQDHVGVHICMEMLENDLIKAVWFETHDDITIIWENGGKDLIEFIQVKAESPTSRWSIPNITERDNGRSNTSIVEKSLNRCKYSEPARFKIVTSYDINTDLSILKLPLGCPERLAKKSEEGNIVTQLIKKLGPVKSENGTDLDYWVKNCVWDKLPDTLDSIRNNNIIKLESVMKLSFSQILFPDHRDELYNRFLMKIAEASVNDINQYKDCYKIERKDLMQWIQSEANKLSIPTSGVNNLISKLEEANIDFQDIESAKELKWKYKKERLNSDYLKPSDLDLLEGEVQANLKRLKYMLFHQNNGSTLSGKEFHSKCYLEIGSLVDKGLLEDRKIPQHFAIGYMYELTNRCLHRFSEGSNV
ncbi:dsDNA nuclease domain-containing protein [Leptospira kmetyi]|uniref:dsDNA nuclease domain-containing protein n=1 Tax=Leptospira kmetyi TaxID=408139 RepID=UPI003EBFE451